MLWIMFALNLGNADRGIYISKIANAENTDPFQEPIYTAILRFTAKYSDIQGLIFFTATCFILAIFLLRRLSANCCMALAGYMIAIFFFDVVQLRFTLAICFVYVGITLLLTVTNDFKATSLFVICVLLAACVHTSTIFYLMFSVLRYIKSDRNVLFIVMSVGIGLAMLVVSSSIIDTFSYFREKLYAVSVTAEQYDIVYILKRICYCLFIPLLFMYCYRRFFEKNSIRTNVIELYVAKSVYRCNLMLLSVIPLLFFSADFHRIFFAMYIVNLTIISRWMTVNNKFIMSGLFILVSSILLRMALGGDNIETVFWSVLNKNMIFDL